MSEMQKHLGVTDFVSERTYPEEHLNLSMRINLCTFDHMYMEFAHYKYLTIIFMISGFVSEEDLNGCKS